MSENPYAPAEPPADADRPQQPPQRFTASASVPVPPPAPEIMVAMPSPRKARPRYGSRLRPVITPMAFTWPRFSATRMIATGAISAIAPASKTGVWKFGRPNQAAEATELKSIGLPMPRPLVQIA